MPTHWYFAYGSNLDADRKALRTGPIREARRVHLRAYRLVFNKRGSDGTGKANIVPDPVGVVWGVIYRCTPAALLDLDRFEGVSRGHYSRTVVRVTTDTEGDLDAVTYVAGPAFIDESVVPSPEYMGHILRGAHQHDLPAEYIKVLERVSEDVLGE